ncbi:uncharacterized protein LOC131248146 [Magnolia sinica]|uniref:uncharacterized protein LOC131248146 n=1 Tax=Magnolia sinica TaxID=86752 RepID=UPI00265A640C|nr:uncharacterized protein LOC131248146 [Magnolia sinica]
MAYAGSSRLMASPGRAPLRTSCRSDSAVSSDSAYPQNRNPLPRFALSKPSWVVRTEANVWKEERKKPNPPCVVCSGSGRVDCHHCRGRGRTNCINLTMLPKGEWPKWCRTCGGSGLGYCDRCLGTGEYRDVMGFHFMKIDPNSTQNRQQNQLHQ